jgi:hypothetical protein
MEQNQKNELQNLRAELKKAKEALALDLENWNPATVNSIKGLVNQSKAKLPNLINDIGSIILANSKVTFVERNNPTSPELIKQSKSKENSLAIDYLTIEKGMVKRFYQDQKEGFRIITDTTGGMNEYMFAVGREIGAESMPSIQISATDHGTYKTKEDIILKFETILEKSYKGELKPMVFVRTLMGLIGEDNSKDYFDILIYNAPVGETLNRDLKMFQDMSGLKPNVASVTSNVTEEQVAETAVKKVKKVKAQE